MCLSSASENRTAGWVSPLEAERPISGQEFITLSLWEQLLHAQSGSHHIRTTLLINVTPLFKLSLSISCFSSLSNLLLVVFPHSTDVLMSVSLFQVIFHWGFSIEVSLLAIRWMNVLYLLIILELLFWYPTASHTFPVKSKKSNIHFVPMVWHPTLIRKVDSTLWTFGIFYLFFFKTKQNQRVEVLRWGNNLGPWKKLW